MAEPRAEEMEHHEELNLVRQENEAPGHTLNRPYLNDPYSLDPSSEWAVQNSITDASVLVQNGLSMAAETMVGEEQGPSQPIKVTANALFTTTLLPSNTALQAAHQDPGSDKKPKYLPLLTRCFLFGQIMRLPTRDVSQECMTETNWESI